MNYLALEVFNRDGNGSKFANLDDNASITITITSAIFDSGDIWTHDFTLSIPANTHIFGSAGELHGSRLHEQVDKRRARLWVMGLPLYYGYIRLGDEVEVDEEGKIDISFESGQKTFQDMIDGGKANQVPLMNDVQFGVALWRQRWVEWWLNLEAWCIYENGKFSGKKSPTSLVKQVVEHWESSNLDFKLDGDESPVQQYPKMVYPKGTFYSVNEERDVELNFLNTDIPYDDGHPYCNVSLCYQQRGYPTDKNGNTDYSGSVEAKRGYEVMPANRVNSAPCFYVIYWIRSLMKYLGIKIEENQMMEVEDLRRLYFLNTKCAYEEPTGTKDENEDARHGRYLFPETSTRLVPEKVNPQPLFNEKDSKFDVVRFEQSSSPDLPDGYYEQYLPKINAIMVGTPKAKTWSTEEQELYKNNNRWLFKAFATSECFPDEDIKTTIDALQNAFGVRLFFGNDYKDVRIILLRNIFRNTKVNNLKAGVVSVTKQENSIRGFRMTFGAGEEDTTFFYRGFANKLPSSKTLWANVTDKHDYSWWNLTAAYSEILDQITAFNKTCYVVPATGNAYGIKVDKDAKTLEEMHPSLFEYAGYMDAEDGDCTGEEETIKEINVGFKPAIMNDVNFQAQRDKDINPDQPKQRFSLFVDEEMKPRRPDLEDLELPKTYNDSDAFYDVDGKLYKDNKFKNMMVNGVVQPGLFAISSDAIAAKKNLKVDLDLLVYRYSTALQEDGYGYGTYHFELDISGRVNEGYQLYLQDNYEPNDDGVSPIENHEWGLTFGIMRGSGSDASIESQLDEYDGEGNDTWEIHPGSNVTSHPDVTDDYGQIFDYADSEIIGTEGYTGYEYGDMLLSTFGCQDICNLKELKGPLPTSGRIIGVLPSYGYDEHPELNILTDEGYYAVESVITDASGIKHTVWLSCVSRDGVLHRCDNVEDHILYLQEGSDDTPPADANEIIARENSLQDLRLIAVDPKTDISILRSVCNYYLKGDAVVHSYFDDRVSLKLRAEKPNPYFDPSKPESQNNQKYLEITNQALKHRGLADRFYKEYSYWVRNARIAKMSLQMEIATLLGIDMTVRQQIGDITGFIKKMQLTVNNKKGMSNVETEVWYL